MSSREIFSDEVPPYVLLPPQLPHSDSSSNGRVGEVGFRVCVAEHELSAEVETHDFLRHAQLVRA